jgi:hypothetical protein
MYRSVIRHEILNAIPPATLVMLCDTLMEVSTHGVDDGDPGYVEIVFMVTRLYSVTATPDVQKEIVFSSPPVKLFTISP